MGLLVGAAALLAVALLAPAAAADTLFYADRLTVHDANGRMVGSAWPASGGMNVIIVEFRRGSTPVIVGVRPDGFIRGFLRFPNAGCTGQPLVDAFWGELYRYTAVVGPRSTVYVQSGAVRMWTKRSTLTADGRCNDHEPSRDLAAAVTAIGVNLADEFMPPFTTRTTAGAAVPLTAP
jgi:hypothetical protein